ncbi:hypothetical protein BCR34DRAFT_280422 [Clohesyomyces aquaticus]|uniref:Uncharacterized protein n=1 Tax=Clohesyomyces aquaticus TaxID=1231657 RepID=A0A1Y1Y0M7_9PLEO|nr:hypothetical protein BCR34DRAFT_280422 [Clohesyomyces aquaticus]
MSMPWQRNRLQAVLLWGCSSLSGRNLNRRESAFARFRTSSVGTVCIYQGPISTAGQDKIIQSLALSALLVFMAPRIGQTALSALSVS